MKAKARAHTNIALIKYWGKRNEEIILPTNNSLSMTLDRFYTETRVEFRDDLQKDEFWLNDEKITGGVFDRTTGFLDLLRKKSGKNLYAHITSENFVPTAAGFASSASGFAALAAAGTKALGMDVRDAELSRLTRQGSGSACRSIYGGFVEWEKGKLHNGEDSFAVQLTPQDYWDVRIMAVEVSQKEKKILSREGMKRTVDTSIFYDGWLDNINTDLADIKQAIGEKDFRKMGEIAEANCMKMHATTFGANPPFTYWMPLTIEVMQTIWQLRAEGIPAYFTIDAGPNVKVLYLPEYEDVIQSRLEEISGVTNVVTSKIGKGIEYID